MSVAEMSVAEMSWPKRPWPKCPWPKCPSTDVGYGGCEPRIEGIVQCTKRYCTISRRLKRCWGEGQYLNPKHSLCI